MRIQKIIWPLVLGLIAGMFVVSCSRFATAPSSAKTAAPAQPTAKLATPVPVTLDAPESVPLQDSAPAYTEKVNLDTFAPPGRGRELLIMNCDNCHSWVCTLQGKRPVSHWESIKYGHRIASLVNLPDPDWDTVFAYLEENFDNRQPEPRLPSAYDWVWCDSEALE